MRTVVQIYVGVCVPTRKIYVGSSFNSDKRIHRHKLLLNSGKHVNRHMQSSWRKYGAENFSWSVVDECQSDVRNDREQQWIDFLRTSDPTFGFNAQFPVRALPPSVVMSGIHKKSWSSDAARKSQMSVRMRNQWSDPEYRKKRLVVLDAHRQKSAEHTKSADFKKMISRITKERWADPELRSRGSKQLAEARAAWVLRRENDPAYKKSHSDKVKRGWSQEAKARASLRKKQEWKDPELRARRLAGWARSNARRSQEAARTGNDIV